MIDVMFFLLVTFMLASLSMQSLNSITVNLPQGDAPNLQHKEPVTTDDYQGQPDISGQDAGDARRRSRSR